METPEVIGNFRRSIKTRQIPVYSIVYLYFRTLSVAVSSFTLQVSVVLKSQYLFVVGAKQLRANQNVRYECFHFAILIIHILCRSCIMRMQQHWFYQCGPISSRTPGVRFYQQGLTLIPARIHNHNPSIV